VSQRENKVFGANATGLERRGFNAETIDALHKVFRLLTRAGLNTRQAVERIQAEVPSIPEVDEVLAFIARSERGFVK
jgi:UDP-N-acetylglucosamine acyltransferase